MAFKPPNLPGQLTFYQLTFLIPKKAEVGINPDLQALASL
jgi:hypothetical protein